MHASSEVELRRAAAANLAAQAPAAAAYSTIVLGVDSVISRIDGIEWLAARRGEDVSRRVAELGAQAREGSISPEQAFAERLAAIRPRRGEVDALSRAYVDAIAPGCADALRRFRRSGVRIVIVSSGLRHALYRLAYRLGIDAYDVHAVDIRFDALGAYLRYDEESPLTSGIGKRSVIEALDVERPLLVAGERASDFAIRGAAELFVSFAGPATRETTPGSADLTIGSFNELASIVFP